MPSVQVDGVRETIARLRALPKKIGNKVTRKAVRAGGREQAKEMRRTAPVRNKVLRKGTTQRVSSRRGVVTSYVGVRNRKDPKTGQNPIHYLHLVERGTKPHVIAGTLSLPSGDVVRRVAHPGSRPAYYVAAASRNSRDRALKAHNDKMRVEIDSEVRQLGGKA